MVVDGDFGFKFLFIFVFIFLGFFSHEIRLHLIFLQVLILTDFLIILDNDILVVNLIIRHYLISWTHLICKLANFILELNYLRLAETIVARITVIFVNIKEDI